MGDSGGAGLTRRSGLARPGVRAALAWACFSALSAGALLLNARDLRAAVGWCSDCRNILAVATAWPPGSGLSGLLRASAEGVNTVNHFRPLTWMLWAVLNRAWGHERVEPYFAASLLLHFAAGLCVLAVLRALLGPKRGWAPAVLGALFFVAHPIHRETLPWLAAQEMLVLAPLYLGALWLFLRWRERGGAALYCGALALGLCAALAYEFAATLGLVLIAWTLADPRPGEVRRTGVGLLGAAPFLLLGPLILGLMAAAAGRGVLPGGFGHGPAVVRLARAYLSGIESPASLAETLALRIPEMMFAFPGRLGPGEATAVHLVYRTEARAPAAAAIACFAALFLFAARSGAWRRTAAQAVLLGAIFLLPVISLSGSASLSREGLENVSPHYLYIPLVGAAACVAAALAEAFDAAGAALRRRA